MKKWQLQEAKKYLTEIVDDVLQGEIQGIVKPGCGIVYLVLGQRYKKQDKEPNFFNGKTRKFSETTSLYNNNRIY